MHDDDRPRYRYRSRSRDHDRDHDYDHSYRRSSRSPRARRERGDDGDYDYYRSRKEDDDGRRSSPSGFHHHHARPHRYDSSLPYDDDGPDHRDRRPPARSRSRSPRRPYGPGRPSSTIIVEGLPSEATEDDILDGFAGASPDAKVFSADSVKVVRLRNNKRGRRIGFVEFYSINDAAHFLEFHYPGLELQLAHSRGVDSDPVSVGINYSRGREDEGGRDERGRDDRGRDEQDWTCPECAYLNYNTRNRCHRCRAAKPDNNNNHHHHHGRDDVISYGPPLTGETDECPQQIPSQYLVVRGLDPTITEELFADGVRKLYVEARPEPKKDTQNKLKSTAPTARTASLGARPDSLRRVFLVRDKKTDEAMRYGFAEFATLEDAQGAIAKFRASPNITISSKPVTVAFIHTGVFTPHAGQVTEDNRRYVFSPIYNREIYLKYWDSRVYPSALRVTEDVVDTPKNPAPDSTGSPEKPGAGAADEATAAQDAAGRKMKKFRLGQAAAKPAVVMGPQMQMWAKKRAELVGQSRADADDGAEPSPAPTERPQVVRRARSKESYTSFGDLDSLSCMLCMRRFSSLAALRDHETLNREHQAHRADQERRAAAGERLRAAGKAPQVITLRVAASSAPSMAPDKVYTSYADREQLHCLICQRRFTKPGVLSLHERESEMHRRNLADQGNVDRATSQLARMGRTPRKMVPARKGAQYRDRAKERRRAYNQPNAPRRKAPLEPAPAGREPEKAAAPSKGAALLGKMGWTAGEGLGADRSGRTDTIATDVYAAGVGLGAEGGKLGDAATEAARKTKDNYSDFVEVTRNKARERYERLG